MKKIFWISILALLVAGCAAVGPSVIKTYNDDISERSQIAILRADKSKGLSIIGCDGLSISHGARYILLQPGRHEVWFFISGQTLFQGYTMTNKKYLDAEAGHTYILKSKGGGIFLIGDKWFPEVIDVTDDPMLHLKDVPEEAEKI